MASESHPCSWCSPTPADIRHGGAWVAIGTDLLWVCRACIVSEHFEAYIVPGNYGPQRPTTGDERSEG